MSQSHRWLWESAAATLALAATVAVAIAPGAARAQGGPPGSVPGYSWVATANGNVPPGAVAGGYENGHPLFICHTHYATGVHPGKVVGPNCNIGYGGQEVTMPQYEVLVGPPGHWIAAGGGTVPPNAVAGGFENGRQLFICRTHYATGVHPGKVVGPNCNIGYGGQEVTVPQYEVLVP